MSPSFKKLFHPQQDSSGLIPPIQDGAVWKSPATPKAIENPWAPKAVTAAPTLEEKQQAALDDAINYIQHLDESENKNLACVLMLRHDISRKDADSIVARAKKSVADAE